MAEPGPPGPVTPSRPSAQLPLRVKTLLPLFLVLLGLATAHLYGRSSADRVVELSGNALGTTWTVKLGAGDLTPEATGLAAEATRERLARVDALMSTWKPDSELSRFNTSESTAPFRLAPETLAVFEIAQQVSVRSGGAFDVTVGPLVQAWGFGSEGRRDPPSDAELSALRASVGADKLVLDAAAGTIAKRVPALAADLSAVAKGYAVDEVARGLEALGYPSYLVEVGGELRARGLHADARPWRVAIEAPDETGRRIHRVVELRNSAMATSGDYRNYYEREGVRLSHTIDPRTGRPIRHRLASVTVLHPEAGWADAWATALNVLGPEAGYTLAASEGLAAYFIVRRPGEADGAFEVRMTPDFEPHLAEER